MSWRPAPQGEAVKFSAFDFKQWLQVSDNLFCRITEEAQLEISRDHGQTGVPSMKGGASRERPRFSLPRRALSQADWAAATRAWMAETGPS